MFLGRGSARVKTMAGLFLRKVARECQNARVISFVRAIAQVKIHKHCLFLGKDENEDDSLSS